MEQFLPLLVLMLISLFFNRGSKKKRPGQKGGQGHSTEPVLTNERNREIEEEQQRLKREQQRRERERVRQLEQQRQAKLEQQRELVTIDQPPRNLQEAAEVLLSQTMRNMEERKLEPEVKIEQLKEQEAIIREKAKSIRPASSEGTESKSNMTKKSSGWLVNENDIVKGIIMAEVLGPPRAKRPYHRSYE